jgi:hypothetical protein
MDASMILKYTRESSLLNAEIGVFNQHAPKINFLKQKLNLFCDTLRIYSH